MDWARIAHKLGVCPHPASPNLRDDDFGDLDWEHGPRAYSIEGDPDQGKTEYGSDQVVNNIAVKHPESGMVILDASGALKNAILNRILTLPEPQQSAMLARLRINILCHPEYVKPMPEFHPRYGVPMEDQVNRVAKNFQQLNPEIMQAGVAGGIPLSETLKQLGRLLSVMVNQHGETFQIPEARELISNLPLLKLAVSKYGDQTPRARDYLMREVIDGQTKNFDKSYTLRNALGVIDSRSAIATLAWHTPHTTIKEVADQGLIYIVSGEMLLNQEDLLGYFMVQWYSLFMEYASQRSPNDPKNSRLFLIIDELPWLLQYPGVEGKVADLVSRYRARNVCAMLIMQSRSQLGEQLLPRSWTFGSQVTFRLSNWEEALALAQQRLQYNPKDELAMAPTTTKHVAELGGKPVTFTVGDRTTLQTAQSQYDQYAYWIQHLRPRECVVLREGDKWVRHVVQTREVKFPPPARFNAVHNAKIMEDTVAVRDGVELSNARIDSLKLGKFSPPSV